MAVIWTSLTAAFALLASLDRAFPPPIEGIAVSRVVNDSDGLPLRTFPVEDGRWRLAADSEEIDPRFIDALLLIEDKRFKTHPGVDPVAVLRAAKTNASRGRVVSGASTLTMQTARLLEPRPRTMGSKLVEMVRARQIERRLTKAEILELYLTLAPYGGNLEGLRTATRAYFGKDPKQLTDSEIALLIALPQSPEARRPDLRPQAAAEARLAILRQLAERGFLSEQRMAEAHTDPLPQGRFPFPGDAWHFAERVSARTDGRGHVGTLIERPTQIALERILREAAVREGPAVQAAGLVVRIEDRAILASVGSASRRRPGGWLDLTNRDRSPGSTLKPLIYALAMQEGLVEGGTRITDLPSRFGTYEPQNFGRSFHGELTVAEALQHSLNVPAVLLLDLLGTERLTGALRAGGIDASVPRGVHTGEGLAVALGGLGLTAEDLALLYAALGDGGIVKPLRRDESQPVANGTRLISQEAAAEVLEILRDAPSLEGRMPADLARSAPRIAFKTGTSYGFRDAWAVGVSEEHVVVVWIGRADGAARPGATGRKTALPVLFEAFDAIERPVTLAAEVSVQSRTPETLRSLARSEMPIIIFPPDGSTLWPRADGGPFVLAGRGQGELLWYTDGKPVAADEAGNVLWQPPGPGFYRLAAVDKKGRKASVKVRVTTDGS
ncbi:penicillin-binding protein 1C [Parvularcula lutaonensis]|uniref:peptidoglycan glycosyltransferase n=1 Tax=Parvularcula lutaonensis TaxID=491923 RepID=A0ABV7MFQ1_9PROT|nr:penicillin-binding protein 1C [Parvularcula lutaonensis]GGY55128.1 penicillin-binding protein 1C [Parvularcula lutaonensis]